MSSFKPVLCGVDDSPHSMEALRHAAQFARELSTDLVLVHVEPEPRREALFAPPPAPQGASSSPRQRWCDVASDIRGKPVELRSATGDPAARIADLARQSGCGLIVLGSRARTSTSLALGSVAAGVLVHAPCPVMIVPSAGKAAPVLSGVII